MLNIIGFQLNKTVERKVLVKLMIFSPKGAIKGIRKIIKYMLSILYNFFLAHRSE